MNPYTPNLGIENSNFKYSNLEPSVASEPNPCQDQPIIPISIPGFLNQLPCVNWILDVRTGTYTFVSENTLEHFGYHTLNYIAKGSAFQDEIKHPEDRANARYLLRQVWHKLRDLPPDLKSYYRFSFDYRIVKPDGKAIRVLEQNSILQQDEDGNITHLLGICNEITEWKKTGPQLASLSSPIDQECHLFSTNNITTQKSDAVLSRRELEILKLISEGHSSKFIANKLFISFHTVNTHRQKMIEKTKSKNASSLVQFAICNGLI